MTIRMEPTRQDDEVLLQMVRLRSEGASTYSIAERFGRPQKTVCNQTNAVKAADLDGREVYW